MQITSISSCILVLQVTLSVCSLYGDATDGLSKNSLYGDGTVVLSKDTSSKKQLNIYKGDYFLVKLSLRREDNSDSDKYNYINVTQSVRGLSEDKSVKIALEKIDNDLFKVTSVYPVNKLGGTVVSASYNAPHGYQTKLVVSNGTDAVLPNGIIRTILLNSYGIVTNSGIQVKISV